jgi:hypothetical protein
MIRIDFDKLLDTATVDDYIRAESGKAGMEWLRDFWSRFLVDADGKPVDPAEARSALGKLTLNQFKILRREGEVAEIAVPLASETS